MRVLMVGGGGKVGSILRPALEARHDCRYLDLAPVPGAEERTYVGSVTSPEDLARALAGCQAAVQLAMARWTRPPEPPNVDGMYDVHTKGMHRLIEAAHEAGCTRIVYASTLSVYHRSRPPDGPRDETVPADARDLYGLTKRLGETVCEALAARWPELSLLALRLVLPQTEAEWAASQDDPRVDKHFRTGPEDLRRAFLAALELTGHTGYDAISICSDLAGRHLVLDKAARLLGWRPEGR